MTGLTLLHSYKSLVFYFPQLNSGLLEDKTVNYFSLESLTRGQNLAHREA